MKERILIVDDNPIDRKVVLHILKNEYDCDLATNYKDATELIRQYHYSAIIMDFYLESSVDSEVLENIKQLRTHTNGSVFIVCSSNDNIVEDTEISNIDAFICKKRIAIIPDRLRQIKKNKKEIYEKCNIFSKLLPSK